MDTVLAGKQNDTVYAQGLLAALNHYAPHIKFLSLDCFDTLLWRMTESPVDVFVMAQQTQAFQAVGLTAALRSQAEAKARQMRCMQANIAEIKLNDIYRSYFPAITKDQLAALTQAELDAEISVCYAFPPIIELIRAAHQRGIKIIIVSDTYFSEPQLRAVFAKILPHDILPAIDKIFCSSDHEVAKINGLFGTVIRTLKEKPTHFLHIGDNLTADYIAARTSSLHALHFIQDHSYVKNLQRLHGMASSLMDPSVRSVRPLFNPFRAIFSMSTVLLNQSDGLIGYYSLGPVLYTFAQFILNEVEKIRLLGKKPKVLFLMRDAYLPALACEALAGEAIGTCVRLPRFAAYAASFRTEEDIDNYLLGLIKSKRFHDLARQLLLPHKVSEPIIRAVEKSAEPEMEFMRLIHRRDVLQIIFKKSAEYRERLKRYLIKEAQLNAGDTAILVDLGYAGTTQRQLAFLFEEMGVEVEGRYLISLAVAKYETPRSGLLDPTHYDNKTLFSVLYFIALFEQLCTANEKSVIDYDDEGDIIFSDVMLSDQQQLKLLAIQTECLRFVRDAKKFLDPISEKFSGDMQRSVVLAELARMVYLPTGQELNYLQSFQFDINLGTQDTVPLFDPKSGLAGLKRRGLFYIDRSQTSRRTNYPAELRIAGFELALTFMSHIRFNLDVNLEDMLPRQEFIETHFLHQQNWYAMMLGASATHDGYYAIWLDLKAETSFLIGKKYQWIQIESAEFIKKELFASQQESGNLINAHEYLIFNNIINHSGELFQCLSESSSITIKPAMLLDNTDYIFRLVYRPIVFQTQEAKLVTLANPDNE